MPQVRNGWVTPTSGDPVYYNIYNTTSGSTALYNNGLLTATTSTNTWLLPQTVFWSNHYNEQSAQTNGAHEQQEMIQLAIQTQLLQQTQESQERYRQQAERYLEDQTKRAEVREAARKRAEDLLLENLTPAQQHTYRENSWFVVKGGKTGTKYRINCKSGFVGNVDVFDKEEQITHRLCAHIPTHEVPVGDNLLAQKLMIELDEESFVRKANVHRYRL